jgi:hypothetical protein
LKVLLVVCLCLAGFLTPAIAQSVPVAMSNYTCNEFLAAAAYSLDPEKASPPQRREVVNFIYAVGFAMGYYQRTFEVVSQRETLVRDSMLNEGMTAIILGCKAKPESLFMEIVRPMKMMFGKYSD